MNIERVIATRDLIAAQPPEALNMDSWFTSDDFDYVYNDGEDGGGDGDGSLIGLRVPEHNCGTVACIGGWAVTQMARDLGVSVIPTDRSIGETAAHYLGLNSEQADALFRPINIQHRTQADALVTLDHLIATGEVSWV